VEGGHVELDSIRDANLHMRMQFRCAISTDSDTIAVLRPFTFDAKSKGGILLDEAYDT